MTVDLKMKSALLSLVLLSSCASTALAAPSAPVSAKEPAGASAECMVAVKKAMPELNKVRTADGNASVDVPNCGTLSSGPEVGIAEEPTADDLAAMEAAGIDTIGAERRTCKDAGGYTAYKNVFGHILWRVSSRMRFCYDTIDEYITYFQAPPTVTFFVNSGYHAWIIGRESNWEDEPSSAIGNTTSSITFGRIFELTVQHQIEVFGTGAVFFYEYN